MRAPWRSPLRDGIRRDGPTSRRPGVTSRREDDDRPKRFSAEQKSNDARAIALTRALARPYARSMSAKKQTKPAKATKKKTTAKSARGKAHAAKAPKRAAAGTKPAKKAAKRGRAPKKTSSAKKSASVGKANAKKGAAPKKAGAKKSAAPKKAISKKPGAKKAGAKKSAAPKKAAPRAPAAATSRARKPSSTATHATGHAVDSARDASDHAQTESVSRRDATGHLDPKYAAELHALSREGEDHSTDRAFVEGTRSADGLAEELAEEFVESATSGEEEGEESLNEDVPEDTGGPFVQTTGGTEFADGTDASNPEEATREPFPKS